VRGLATMRFRFRVFWALYAVCLVGLAAHVAGFLPLGRHRTFADEVPRHIALVLVITGRLAYDVLLARRGGVLVGPDTVTLLDWRGRPSTLSWETITECRRRTGLAGWWARFPVEIRARSGASLQVWRPLADAPGLVQAIVQRAGLTESARKWWGVTYTRPTP